MKPKREPYNCLDCNARIWRRDMDHFVNHPFCDGCHLHHYGRENNIKLVPEQTQAVFSFIHEDSA